MRSLSRENKRESQQTKDSDSCLRTTMLSSMEDYSSYEGRRTYWGQKCLTHSLRDPHWPASHWVAFKCDATGFFKKFLWGRILDDKHRKLGLAGHKYSEVSDHGVEHRESNLVYRKCTPSSVSLSTLRPRNTRPYCILQIWWVEK